MSPLRCPWGVRGGLLCDPHHQRADARMAARLLSLGVMSDEQAAALLRGAAKLAANAAANGRSRDYAAAMKVLLTAGKLELEHAKLQLIADAQPPSSPPPSTLTLQERTDRLVAFIDAELERRAALGDEEAGEMLSRQEQHKDDAEPAT